MAKPAERRKGTRFACISTPVKMSISDGHTLIAIPATVANPLHPASDLCAAIKPRRIGSRASKWMSLPDDNPWMLCEKGPAV